LLGSSFLQALDVTCSVVDVACYVVGVACSVVDVACSAVGVAAAAGKLVTAKYIPPAKYHKWFPTAAKAQVHIQPSTSST